MHHPSLVKNYCIVRAIRNSVGKTRSNLNLIESIWCFYNRDNVCQTILVAAWLYDLAILVW